MRLGSGGLIDRGAPLRFGFDGRTVAAFAGDTVASALIGADIRVVGRSFKYHRPRGVVAAGPDEPNALVTSGRGAARRPNLKATQIEAAEGLRVTSQSAWPHRRLDLGALADLAAPLLPAGFYYKTFMRPAWAWERLWEPLIRRAAGLGRLSGLPAADDCDRGFLHCDVLVIGAGPAGLMAARAAAGAGARVILAEEDPRPGGRLLAERGEIDGRRGGDWAEDVARDLRARGVRVMTRTAVTGAYDGGVWGALERAAPGAAGPPATFWRIAAARAVLAAGAHERGIAFPGNDRPGVMLAGALRAYVNRWAVVPGRRVAVWGNSDEAVRTARDLAAAGVEVTALIDARDAAPDDAPDCPVFGGARVVSTTGRQGLRAIEVAHSGGRARIDCDALAVSGGWNPAVQLSCHLGARPVWREDIAAFVAAEGAVPGLEIAGAADGVFGTRACLESGEAAGGRAARALGLTPPEPAPPAAGDEGYGLRPLWRVAGRGRAFLDLQNDVTVADVELAARENYSAAEHMKRYTTQGMSTDQGRSSNVVALAVLAEATGRDIAETGSTTHRPPTVPVEIRAWGAGASGMGFAPVRRAPSEAAARARGAPMVEAGQWYRPSYFPAPGERVWRESADREWRAVRETVGVADVSTLGKIEILGADAGAFLDFAYANRISTLRTGRVRYALMLREDGHVMDDGTVARLEANRFLLTTTTAAAGQVLTHLRYLRDCFRAGLDAGFVAVTDAWAQFAVAGPRARRLMSAVLDEDAAPGFMEVAPARVGGVEARLFGISFSGEAGWELAVPARYGPALWRRLAAEAESLGGAPYGMEAMNVLRLEKGFLTHAEMNGRTTAYDLGLQRMLKTEGEFVGRAAAGREGLLDPGRERLVGLVPVGAVRTMAAGALLFPLGAAAVRETIEGHVTSTGYSPREERHVGLGFLQRGPERMGERLRMVDALRGHEAIVEVGPVCRHDPDGTRTRR